MYRSLDHWRGVAVLWVVLFHGFGTSYDSKLHPAAAAIRALAEPGWLGVHIFFVISGYCIGANVTRLAKSGLGPREFISGRLLRIFPTYWAAFAATLLLNLLASAFNRTAFMDNFPASPAAWIGNLLLLQPYLEVRYYLIIYWSLVVEVGFYLLVALLWVVYSRSRGAALALGVGLTLLSVFTPQEPKAVVLSCWAEFVCGLLTFGAVRAQAEGRRGTVAACLVAIAILGALGAWLAATVFLNQLWFAALFSLLLFALHPMDEAISSSRLLRWLFFVGTISYSVYLIHLPFGGRVVGLGSRVLDMDSPLFVFLQAGYWCVAIAASFAFYWIVERRFERWRHGLRKRSPMPRLA